MDVGHSNGWRLDEVVRAELPFDLLALGNVANGRYGTDDVAGNISHRGGADQPVAEFPASRGAHYLFLVTNHLYGKSPQGRSLVDRTQAHVRAIDLGPLGQFLHRHPVGCERAELLDGGGIRQGELLVGVGIPDLVGYARKDGRDHFVFFYEFGDRGRGGIVRARIGESRAVEGKCNKRAPMRPGVERQVIGELGHERQSQSAMDPLSGGHGRKLELATPLHLDFEPVREHSNGELHFGVQRGVLDGVRGRLRGSHLDVVAPFPSEPGLACQLGHKPAGTAHLAQVHPEGQRVTDGFWGRSHGQRYIREEVSGRCPAMNARSSPSSSDERRDAEESRSPETQSNGKPGREGCEIPMRASADTGQLVGGHHSASVLGFLQGEARETYPGGCVVTPTHASSAPGGHMFPLLTGGATDLFGARRP